ncbi:MAG TPA: class I SAM-dependent methyltransferase [Xanthobacteraceae bacterium]|nr:class I SAM-dependent methyltransferase [Xanthobacteraceae bacterium]
MPEASAKPYIGRGMEGFIATLYARQAEHDRDELQATARRIAAPLTAGSRVLEIAPGPGLLAIELARLTGARVTGIDISRTFVQIAGDFEHGDAADLPFPDDQFDCIVCRAAFKNFSRPLVALNEMHRVLKPGGSALVIDLRKDYSSRAVADYFKNRGAVGAAMIKLTFRFMLKGRAYTKDSMVELVSRSQFGHGEFRLDPIGFELTLRK